MHTLNVPYLDPIAERRREEVSTYNCHHCAFSVCVPWWELNGRCRSRDGIVRLDAADAPVTRPSIPSVVVVFVVVVVAPREEREGRA